MENEANLGSVGRSTSARVHQVDIWEHKLHCTQCIRKAFSESFTDTVQSVPKPHANGCLTVNSPSHSHWSEIMKLKSGDSTPCQRSCSKTNVKVRKLMPENFSHCCLSLPGHLAAELSPKLSFDHHEKFSHIRQCFSANFQGRLHYSCCS